MIIGIILIICSLIIFTFSAYAAFTMPFWVIAALLIGAAIALAMGIYNIRESKESL